MFAAKGDSWLKVLPALLEEFTGKWQLTGCRTEENLSVHYICYAHSPQYGEVVLKTGVPHLELFTGMDALHLYGGKHACKLYEMNREQGVMLLERILPGSRLKDEPDWMQRMQAGTELAGKLPMRIDGPHDFPAFPEQMEKAFRRARQENRAGKEFLSMLGFAEELYGEVRSTNRPKVLLHGDLHHENILKDEAGQWKVIDPQGRIGEQCLETGRFLRNEWEWFGGIGNLEHMAACIDAFADALGESRRIIAVCCFLDCAISNCWSLEDGSGLEVVDEAMREMKCLLELMKKVFRKSLQTLIDKSKETN
jgi:streptomycin 6-kinase